MRLLIQTLYYPPELTGISKIIGEMAEWLARDGHDVRVVTVAPHYPQWRVHAGYSPSCYRVERGAVTVFRCPLWVPRRPTGLTRLLYLGSFALSSIPIMAAQLAWRPDVAMVIEPPLFCAFHALMLGGAGAETWLNVKDFELDAAFSLGLLRSPRLEGWARKMESWIMRQFSVVASISPAMVRRLITKGVAPEKAILFRDWVDLRAIHADPAAATNLRRELGIPPSALVALYSGNLGEKQGVLLLAAAAKRLQHRPDIVFLICGEGAAKDRLAAAARTLPNFRLHPLVPAERLNALMNLADIQLLPQRVEASELVMPSKLLYMLASARPIVATASADTEVGATVLAVRGRLTPPGDAESFAKTIEELADRPELRAECGRLGREYAETHLQVDPILREFVSRCAPVSRS